MPNWKIHLEIAKRVNDYINYNVEEKEMFLFGDILPDVNNGYIITNISNKIEKKTTHFQGKEVHEKTYVKFYNKYKERVNIKNPLFLGYYMHLYVDYNWNADFYNKIGDIRDTYSREKIREMKQHDFMVYKNKFISNIIKIENYDKLLEKLKGIEEVKVDKNDILKIEEFLISEKVFKGEYEHYTEERLDNLMDNTVEDLVKIIKS